MSNGSCFLKSDTIHEYIEKTGTEEIWRVKYRKQTAELSYLGMNGSVQSRELKLFTPVTGGRAKFPLIMVAHYELTDENNILFFLLNCGFAVLSTMNVPQEHLHNLAGDNLLFNEEVCSAHIWLPVQRQARCPDQYCLVSWYLH